MQRVTLLKPITLVRIFVFLKDRGEECYCHNVILFEEFYLTLGEFSFPHFILNHTRLQS